MKMNLSPSLNEAQRCAAGPKANHSPFAQLVLARTKSARPMRISLPVISARPGFRGNRHYLRALRAAEMAAWQAGRPFNASQFKAG